MFADERSRLALRAERHAFMDVLFEDLLGFAATKMIRRILGFAHNIDFEWIENPDRRAACERATLNLARTLLVFPGQVRSIDALLDLARRIGGAGKLSTR